MVRPGAASLNRILSGAARVSSPAARSVPRERVPSVLLSRFTGVPDVTTPAVVAFDVNETLSDMAPMGQRFADVGLPELTARIWFASVLRDGFALTAAGTSQAFARIAEGALRSLAAGAPLTCALPDAVEHIMSGFMELEVHGDVVDGVTALRSMGLRLVTLTNGSTAVADRLLSAAGIRHHFEQLLSVEQAGAWKPAAAAYAYGARMCNVPPEQMLLVAVHPWDIDGAVRAGLGTAWVNRAGQDYPEYFRPPVYAVSALPELVSLLHT